MKNKLKKQKRRNQGRNIDIPIHLESERLGFERMPDLDFDELDFGALHLDTTYIDQTKRHVVMITTADSDVELIRELEERIKSKGYDVTALSLLKN